MGYWDKKQDEAEQIVAEGGTLESLEGEVLEEIGEIEKSFRERMKNENKRFLDMCDTEYWFCVCFTSRAQKEEMLETLGLPLDEKYIYGRDFAKAVKAQLKTPDLKFAKIKRPNRDFMDRSMPISE